MDLIHFISMTLIEKILLILLIISIIYNVLNHFFIRQFSYEFYFYKKLVEMMIEKIDERSKK